MKQKKSKAKKVNTPSAEDIVSQVDTFQINPDDIDVAGAQVGGAEGVVSESPKKPKKAIKSPPTKTEKQKPTQNDSDIPHIPDVLGILPLRNAVVFPGTVIPLAVGRPRSKRLLAGIQTGESIIGVISQKNPKANQPNFDEMYQTGTAVTILKLLKMPEGQNSVVVHGLTRFRIVQWLEAEPYLKAKIEVMQPRVTPGKQLEALVNSIRTMAQQMIELSPNIPEEVSVILSNIEDPGGLADFLAANVNIPLEKKQELLETVDVTDRLTKLSAALGSHLEMLTLSAKIQDQVSKSIDKTQREYYLQEQLKAIQTELGQNDQKSTEIDQLKDMIAKAQMPESVLKEANRELARLEKIPTMSPDFSVTRSYIEWLCELPWATSTPDKLNLVSAKRILNRDHYNLVKVKQRILEFLAVRKLNPQGRSPILCFVGPPGVGKTSLGKSIAQSMGRKFTRISLGGIRDEADIRGHRRTYIGAIPGRIIQELRKCGSNNPVFMLDELDKIGQDFRGDPAAAMLEVLDPEQNNSFSDHYIDQPFDLSKVMFIATANQLDTIPPALRDRLEVLELPGYTHDEKMAIATRYLIPRQLKENGLTRATLNIKTDTLDKLIESYTREAGVRELERQIAALCRAVAAQIASGRRSSAKLSASHLAKILGPIKYESELALRTSTPGVATGLAYTPAGGEILFIESTLVPGAGKLILTGQMGQVMQESAQAALSALKSIALKNHKNSPSSKQQPGESKTKTTPKSKKTTPFADVMATLQNTLADNERMKQQDIHIHVPAGAIPKDGPSAGIAMYASLASLLSDRPIRPDVAMTGEITLRGLVMPIGGVKEKVLAAKRAGITTVILPERNQKDLADLPKHALKGLSFQFVRHVDKVLALVLEN